MSNVSRNPDGQPVLVLPAVLDLSAASGLKRDLQESLLARQGLEIDARAVQRISSLCLQLLASAAQAFAAADAPGLRFSGVSQSFAEMASGLALSQALGIEGGIFG